jgi:transposase
MLVAGDLNPRPLGYELRGFSSTPPTTRLHGRFEKHFCWAFAAFGAMRILLETGTESEWVAQALERAGHEVIVADPNYAPMYGISSAR